MRAFAGVGSPCGSGQPLRDEWRPQHLGVPTSGSRCRPRATPEEPRWDRKPRSHNDRQDKPERATLHLALCGSACRSNVATGWVLPFGVKSLPCIARWAADHLDIPASNSTRRRNMTGHGSVSKVAENMKHPWLILRLCTSTTPSWASTLASAAGASVPSCLVVAG